MRYALSFGRIRLTAYACLMLSSVNSQRMSSTPHAPHTVHDHLQCQAEGFLERGLFLSLSKVRHISKHTYIKYSKNNRNSNLSSLVLIREMTHAILFSCLTLAKSTRKLVGLCLCDSEFCLYCSHTLWTKRFLGWQAVKIDVYFGPSLWLLVYIVFVCLHSLLPLCEKHIINGPRIKVKVHRFGAPIPHTIYTYD